jgi:hypothetical protein
MRDVWLILVGVNSAAIITYFVGAPHQLPVLIPGLIASVSMVYFYSGKASQAVKDKAA